ncbi:hypothetical protein ANN_16239 [Periplaneta americana]|uniref:Reverse transcriptase domain-containing protein n=1 Tax=Periplaneta americana TaxID=6978 RepID=A0ABQ8SJI4_PERAM|nr:hypothetical protein ANN_16239 [Periplaneta americana]
MSPESSTESYPAFSRIGLRENPGKNLNQVTCPDRDSNPGHLVSQPDALTVTPQNIVRNGTIKIGDLPFEEVEKFKYLGATLTNINDTREEIKRRINMGNACYYSVEKLLSSSLLSKNLKVRIYKTVILPVVLYGCETWTLSLREEQRIRVFENKVLRKIFGAKRDEVTGEWRKLHNAELHALYSSPDIIRNIKSRRLRWAGHVARMGESRNAYRVLVGRPEGKRPLGRPRRRWEDNIKVDLREVGYDDRDWINLAQDRDRWRAYKGGNRPPGSLKTICKEVIILSHVFKKRAILQFNDDFVSHFQVVFRGYYSSKVIELNSMAYFRSGGPDSVTYVTHYCNYEGPRGIYVVQSLSSKT